MDLYCAIDLLDGVAVRLYQGDYGRRTEYGDPIDLAQRYLEAGARWLHVVDLDAARTGDAANRDRVLGIVTAAHRAGASVEVGGGVRSPGDVDALVAAGADRVIMGTAAIENPTMAAGCARRHPGRVAVGVDYRRQEDGGLEPAVRGWLQGSGLSMEELLDEFDGVPLSALVVTAIERDGSGRGPDTEGLCRFLDSTEVAIVASGGVGSTGDLAGLAGLRSPGHDRSPVGVVVGRALVDGSMTVEEAMAACAASG